MDPSVDASSQTRAASSSAELAVVMAVYDAVDPRHLHEALRSLVDQTRRPDEVVVVEDGPLPAELRQVLAGFAPPVLPLRRVSLSARSGSGPARQAGLTATTAELVAVADADDVSMPERLERQENLLRESAVDVVASAVVEIDSVTGETLGVRRFAEDHDSIVKEMRSVNPLNHPTVMMRRSVALAAGGYTDLPLLEDYDLCARMASRGARLANTEEPLVRFRGGQRAQRRRRSPVALRSEWRLQRNLRSYGLVGPVRMLRNLVVRSGYRLVPAPVARLAYSRWFLSRDQAGTSRRPAPAATPDRPEYDKFTDMSAERGPLAESLARQVLLTTGPFLPGPAATLTVLDVGSGYGHTASALARTCAGVVGLEPAGELHRAALELRQQTGQQNLQFRQGDVVDLDEAESFDLVVLDNVYEHLPEQGLALSAIVRALKPGGCLFIVVPNKLWPIEAHYRLPFLSWLPLRLANTYLRLSRRGSDYEDASYAPTYWGLRRGLGRHGELEYHFVLPGDPGATIAGSPWHYRLGMWLLERFPSLWAISKALVVVAVKRDETSVETQ